MKLTTYLITILATIILSFNVSKIDFETPLVGDSYTAVITVIAAGCAVLISTILRLSKKIDRLIKKSD
jgi:hypothetical protein